MLTPSSDVLVQTDWLADHLTVDVRVVDATWHMPGSGRHGRADYDAGHIPGAVFFDLDDISDSDSPLPHMLPEAAKFASKVRRLGLGNGHRIIIYDRAGGGMAAARVWWMFRYFGHHDVALLNGGFDGWVAEGRPIEDLPPMPRDRHFVPHVNHLLLRDKSQMLANLQRPHEQVIDARAAPRFAGAAPEPWPHNKRGHIPGSKNMPWNALIDPVSKKFLSVEETAARFSAAGIDVTAPTAATCGSGVSACLLAFAFARLGNHDVAVYDGSWAEWGSADDTPVATLPDSVG